MIADTNDIFSLSISLKDILEIKEKRDIFTTPSLDFASHSEELTRITNNVFRFRERLFRLETLNSEMTSVQKLGSIMDMILQSFPDDSPQKNNELTKLLDNYFQNAKKLTRERDMRVAEAVELALEHFNNLTRPPIRRRPISTELKDEFGKEEISISNLNSDNRIYSQHSFDPTLSSKQKAYYSLLRGRLFSVLPEYTRETEENLTKSIKLDPFLFEAWNLLGEHFLKKCDIKQAKMCFDRSLEIGRSFESLRRSALVLRHLDNVETFQNINKSISLCKEAIELDISDFYSWYGLGMSHLKLFFNISKDNKDLRKSMLALNRAESLIKPDKQTCEEIWDLYHNRATLHQYLENFSQSIDDYWKASIYDLSNPCLKEIINVSNFVSEISFAIQKKANIKESTLDAIIKKMKNSRAGSNTKLIMLRLLAEIPHNSSIPQEFIGVDVEGELKAISIFNIMRGAIKVGDEIHFISEKASKDDVFKE
ncbi:hypothetical protein HK096_003329, partial [Nowakowskiella sp. JEL0078]